MKIQSFKSQLQAEVEEICDSRNWKFDNNKDRGMAFETWCFNFFSEKYSSSDNRENECVLRSHDFGIDVVFPSAEFQEVFFIQAKYSSMAAKSKPIKYDLVEGFFSAYRYLFNKKDFDTSSIKNERVKQLFNEASMWTKDGYSVYFIFVSTGTNNEQVQGRVRAYNEEFEGNRVTFEVWDIRKLRDEYVEARSAEQSYPDEISLTLGEGKFLSIDGPKDHLTFVVPGTTLREIYLTHRNKLFNWNIRKFLGKKSSINKGMVSTVNSRPRDFYYLNNGISALCDSFDFDASTRRLTISKFQIVNGAQTIGAIGNADGADLRDSQVLVKLTAVKHAARETGLAASIIRANNTQNSLRVPDFRSNDEIQRWLELKFKNTKAKGELGKIEYGRKRPYPKSRSGTRVVKMVEFGKIRYAWEVEPRLPIAAPTQLFIPKIDGGSYEEAFGEDEKLVEMWSDKAFDEAMLAIHSFNFCQDKLIKLEDESFEITIGDETKNLQFAQISRLKFYALHCMKIYADKHLHDLHKIGRQDLYAFGGKFRTFCKVSFKPIKMAAQQTYREIIENSEGAAFTLPRDNRVWNKFRQNFNDNCELLKAISADDDK